MTQSNASKGSAFLNKIGSEVAREIVKTDIDLYTQYYFNRKLYSYQLEFAYSILSPFKQRIQASTSTKRSLHIPVKNDKREIAALFPKQSGKSETLVFVPLHLIDIVPKFHIGIFAPREKQAKRIIFKRIRDYINDIPYFKQRLSHESESFIEFKDRKSWITAESASDAANIAGLDLDLAICDESQSITSKKVNEDIFPMLGHKNGVLVKIGTVGYSKNHFYEALNSDNYHKIHVSAKRVMKENPAYIEFEKRYRKLFGERSDAYRTQIGLEWLLEIDQAITEMELVAMRGGVRRKQVEHGDVYVGIDSGKRADSTVVTLITREGAIYQIVDWLVMKGDNYADQIDAIVSKLKFYPVKKICIDSTGTQDLFVDMLKRSTRYRIEGVVFNLQNKDRIYRKLLMDIMQPIQVEGQPRPMTRLRYPYDNSEECYEFERQMLSLQKVYTQGKLNPKHPDEAGYHDDFPDSLALAIDAAESSRYSGGGAILVNY